MFVMLRGFGLIGCCACHKHMLIRKPSLLHKHTHTSTHTAKHTCIRMRTYIYTPHARIHRNAHKHAYPCVYTGGCGCEREGLLSFRTKASSIGTRGEAFAQCVQGFVHVCMRSCITRAYMRYEHVGVGASVQMHKIRARNYPHVRATALRSNAHACVLTRYSHAAHP